MVDTARQSAPPAPPWSSVWHLPVLALGLLMFTVGLYMVFTRPTEAHDFAGGLTSVEQYMAANELDEAQRKLAEIDPLITQADPGLQARFQVLMGDLVFLQQQAAGGDLPENHQRVLQHYGNAERMGLVLDALHLQRLAETLVALGRIDQAVAVVDRLREEKAPAAYRYRVIRQIIERQAPKLATVNPDAMAQLLQKFRDELAFESDPGARRRQEVWAVSIRARALLDAADPLRANDYLAKQMIFLKDRGARDVDLVPLVVLYARSFQDAGELPEARRWFLYAQGKLADDRPNALNADVLVGLGQLDLSQTSDVQSAKQHFAQAESEYPEHDPTKPGYATYLTALIGLGDSEAKLGAEPEAIERFSRAVELILKDTQRARRALQEVTDVVRSHFDAAYDRKEYELALGYLEVLRPLPDPPPSLLVELAEVHERIAEHKQALAAIPAGEANAPSREARRLLNQEAANHLAASAEFFLQHAHAVTVLDDDAHGRSLWNAARNFDRAQLWKQAIETYAEFRSGRPGDPRQLEATHHLGRAYMADGQYRAAADLFLELIQHHPRGPVTYDSLTPLARCYIALSDPDAAKRVLTQVVTEHPAITPQSPQYRDALIELGELHYRLHEYADAIARLDEAVQRYGETDSGAVLRYKLADTYRQSVPAIDKELADPMPQSKRMARQAERARRLEQAQVLFSQVIADAESRPKDDLDELLTLYLRNSYFYRADSAYDLGNWELAINLYDLAAKKYDTNPASLVALVQIVNAYCEMGNLQAAAAANRRARDHLRRIPDAAFDDPSLPMSRDHWRRWLEFTAELNLFGPQASAARPAP